MAEGRPRGRKPHRDPRFLAKAARSGLRRYPSAIAKGIRERHEHGHADDAGDVAAGLAGVHEHDFAAAWLGHASVLLRQGGALILADPVLSPRIGVRLGPVTVGKPRLVPVPVDPTRLPRPDLILLSHAHFDHLDRPTLRALLHPGTTVVTARGTRRLVPRGFGRIVELDWNQSVDVAGVRVTAHRPAHWGARTLLDRRRGFNAYEIEGGDRRTFFAGDTALTEAFDALDPVDLAMFGIGAYDPWEHAHATPEQAWRMFRGLGGRWLMPIHHSTFELSDEPVAEPLRRLIEAAREERERLVDVRPGELWVPGRELPLLGAGG